MAITNGYITLDEFKQALGGTILGTSDDAAMELAIESASRLVDEYTERHFWIDEELTSRSYTAIDRKYLDVDDISDATGLTLKTDDDNDGVYETEWIEGTDFRLEPASSGKPYTRIRTIGGVLLPFEPYAIQVTAKGGWPSVPKPIQQATLILALRLYKRKDAPFGISGSPEQQGEMRLLSPIDWDVKELLQPYRVYWAVA